MNANETSCVVGSSASVTLIKTSDYDNDWNLVVFICGRDNNYTSNVLFNYGKFYNKVHSRYDNTYYTAFHFTFEYNNNSPILTGYLLENAGWVAALPVIKIYGLYS